MEQSIKSFERIQRLQDRFASLNDLFMVMLDVSGNPCTTLSGDGSESMLLKDKLGGKAAFIPYLRELSVSSLEEQIVTASKIPGIKLALQAIRHDSKFVGAWAIIFVTDPDMAELPDSFHSVTDESSIYKCLEFLRQATAEYSRLFADYTRANVDKLISVDKASDIEDTLKRNQVNTEVLKLLSNSSPMETIFEKILQVICEHLELSSAGLFNLRGNHLDLVTEWLAAGKVSILEKTRGLPINELFTHDSILVIGSQTNTTLAQKALLTKFKVKSTVIVPIRVDDQIVMYACFNDCDIARNFHTEDIKLINNAAQVIQSILAQRMQKDSLNQHQSAMEGLLDSLSSSVYIVDEDTQNPIFINKVCYSIFSDDIASGRFSQFIDELKFPYEQPVEVSYSIEEVTDWYEVNKRSIKWVDNAPSLMYVLTDITEKKNYQTRIEKLADTDYLTGLYNRISCERDLARLVDSARESGSTGAVLYIDLDDFKHINEGLGHQYGDLLLQNIATGLNSIKGVDGHCYRMGGDEFVIIIPPKHYHRYEYIIEDVQAVFTHPWYLKDNEYYCTMSMGSVTFPGEGVEVHELIQKSDIAMYMAKKQGKNQVAKFCDSIVVDSSRRLGLEKSMRDATASGMGEFMVYFQPIIKMGKDGKDNICCGAEALVRWNSPTLGFVLPSDFIPLAEYLGLINPIGKYVMLEACKACKGWNDNGHPDYKVNVNLSVVQLLQENIVDIVKSALDETGINPQNLTLEVTESLAINDMDKMKTVLSSIRNLGVRIALDDFGTGYSSLNHIREIPLDVIKIDQSFIKDLATSEYAPAFVNMVASLGRAIDVNICVEGIESSDQFDVLKTIPVSMIQGYLFDKPLTQEDFESKYVQAKAQNKNLEKKGNGRTKN